MATKNSDLYDDDLLKPLNAELKILANGLDIAENSLKDFLKVTADINKTLPKTVQQINAWNKATNDHRKAVNGVSEIEKKRAKVLEQLTSLETKEGRALEESRLQLNKKRKAVREEIKAEKGLTTEFEKQSKRLKDLKDKYKNLILVQGKETKATRKLRKEILSLDKNLKKVNASVSSSTGLFSKLKGGVARLGLAFAGLSIIRNVFNVVKDFGQSQANLASVLSDATNPQLERLTQLSKDLGATTKFTASEVSDLQTEFAKLGFSVEQIENATEATLQLAAATNTELAQAASVAGGTINAFGLSAEETQRVVDVMAKSFSSSALDMEKFSETMKNAAPIAKATGVSFELATAAAGKLADANISGSKAGTDLKKIFSELVKDGKPLEESLSDIAKEMDAAESKADKLAIAEKLVGDRAKGALLILVEQKDALADLKVELEGAGGAAEEMADKQLDTLNGAIALLNSAWEGLILKVEEGTGAFGFLKDVITFLAKNLEAIFKVIVIVGAALATYKAVIVATNIATKIYTFTTTALRIAKIALSGGIGKATKTMKLFNKATKANILALVAAAVIAVVVALEAFNSELSTSEKIQKDLLDIQTEALKNTKKEITDMEILLAVAKDENVEKDKRIEAITELNRISPEYLGNLTLENINTEEGVRLTRLYVEELIKVAEAKATRVKIDQISIDIIDAENSALSENQDIISGTLKLFGGGGLILSQRQEVQNRKDNIQALKDERKALIDSLILKTKEGELSISEVTGAEGSEVATAGLIAEKKKQISEESKKRDEATTVSAIRLSQERIKQLQKELDALLGKRAAEKEIDTAFKSFFKQTVEDIIALEKEQQEELEFLYNVQLRELEEFIAEDKRLREERITEENQEYDRQLSDFEAFIQEDKDLKEQRLKDEQEAAEKRAQTISNFADAALEAQQEALDGRLAMFDKEISANEARINALRGQDTQDAQENLAFAKKRQAELEQQKEDQIKKAANTQAALALIGVYQSNIAAGQKPAEALANTAVSAIALKQLISSLDFFWDGTNKTVGEDLGSPLIGGRDGHVIRVDGTEHIVGGKKSAKLKSMGADTTDKITDAAEFMYGGGWAHANMSAMYKAGTKDVDAALMAQNSQTNNAIVEVLNEVNNNIKKIDMPNINFTWDKLTEGFMKELETKNKLERFYQNPQKKPFIN